MNGPIHHCQVVVSTGSDRPHHYRVFCFLPIFWIFVLPPDNDLQSLSAQAQQAFCNTLKFASLEIELK
jgi:hypothetical protein